MIPADEESLVPSRCNLVPPESNQALIGGIQDVMGYRFGLTAGNADTADGHPGLSQVANELPIS